MLRGVILNVAKGLAGYQKKDLGGSLLYIKGKPSPGKIIGVVERDHIENQFKENLSEIGQQITEL